MTRLFDDPASFAEDALAGFCDLHADQVRRVEGGVVRAVPADEGKVAVVVGGGAGHYPAFFGLVGPGFADGAVVGGVFAPPSPRAVLSVARAVHCGAGVLFVLGNYAGDGAGFGAAQERLRLDGIDCRTAVVTDDVASAPAGLRSARRGIAGAFAVFKVAGAAAEEGLALDEVERAARLADDRTRSLGVAFEGCTLPGGREPLFEVPAGKMGLGLGIHGEPGSSELDLPSADRLAELLVDGLLAEAPADAGSRVGVLLNGLGSTGREELFVLWNDVARRLRGAGLEPVEPEAGELVTSLDMAGVSLTLSWLDAELERFWRASADTPAYGKRVRRRVPAPPAPSAVLERLARGAEYPGTGAHSRETAAALVAVFGAVRRAVEEHAAELGRVDAVVADGGHGRGMVRGTAAAHEAAALAVRAGAGVRSTLARAGSAWAGRAGGTSGVLWGTGLRAFAGELSDERAPTAAELAAGVAAFAESIVRTGGARPGDKTMVDAIAPFAAEFAESGSWARAATAARRAAAGTASLRPKAGRARENAERGLGTPDAGALSFALVAETIATAVRSDRE
ncbi:dihydroxyacetone kinase family protein [Saccharopolyspora gregorii]|uniref:D-erythrulose 4-kinase n=1 Tax=Saccharopolyspora gregorii TaxID=33914 RepID=A0ABP6RWJ6_9PSEU